MRYRLLCLAVGLCGLGQQCLAEESALKLLIDPFERQGSVVDQSAAAAVPEPPPWRGRLRMTLRAAGGSYVNVDGESVPLGGKIGGYTLIDVAERSARFTRDGHEITLSLDDEPALPPEELSAR